MARTRSQRPREQLGELIDNASAPTTRPRKHGTTLNMNEIVNTPENGFWQKFEMIVAGTVQQLAIQTQHEEQTSPNKRKQLSHDLSHS